MNSRMCRQFLLTEEEIELSEKIDDLKKRLRQQIDLYKSRIDELTKELYEKVESRYEEETLAEIHDVMNLLDGCRINQRVRDEVGSKVVDIVFYANEQKNRHFLAELKEALKSDEEDCYC